MAKLKQRYRFLKKEKLCSEKRIEELFQKGKWERSGSITCRYLVRGAEKFEFPKVLISVPRKNIRRATSRNRIKRQMREAYRLNKEKLISRISENPHEIMLAFLFNGQAGLPYQDLETDIINLIGRIVRKIPSGK